MPALHTVLDWKKAHEGLKDQLVEWDPIGLLALGAPWDEYDGLVDPLMRKLDAGASPEETGAWLASELPTRFGSTPPRAEIEAFAQRVASWFFARWPPADG